jgi:PhnB protein
MVARLNPYIGFRGMAREALEFYRSVFGGDLEIMTFGEMGDPEGAEADLVMHGRLETPQGFTLMAADAPDKMGLASETFVTISLSGDDPQLREFWAKLSEGGTVDVPFEKQMWGDEFGECTDRYGVRWSVDLGEPGTAG